LLEELGLKGEIATQCHVRVTREKKKGNTHLWRKRGKNKGG